MSLNMNKQEEIVQHLNSINKIFDQKNLSNNEQKILYLKIIDTLKWLDAHAFKVESKLPLQIYEFLVFFHQTKNFTQLFGDYKISYQINNNIAYFIQQNWKTQKSSNLTKNQEYIMEAIKQIKDERKDLNQDCLGSFLNQVKFDFMLSKLYLQLAASCSQFNDHKKALRYGEYSIKYLKSLCKILEKFFNKQGDLNLDSQQAKVITKKIQDNPVLAAQFVSFLKMVKKLNSFCLKVYPSLLNFEEETLDNKHFKNFESIPIRQSNQILQPSWIDKISIANFMHVEYSYLKKLSLSINFQEVFYEGFLSILISLTSVVYFMIATENRLYIILNNKIDDNKMFKIRSIFERNHFEKLRKMKRYVFSEILHAKAISLLQIFFKSNPILNHLTNSFMKNYQFNPKMDDIIEEDPQNQSKGHSFTDSQIEYSFDNSMSQAKVNNSGFMIVNNFGSKNEKQFLQKINEEEDSQKKKDGNENLNQMQNKIGEMIETNKKNFQKSKTMDNKKEEQIKNMNMKQKINSAKKKIILNKTKTKKNLDISVNKKKKKKTKFAKTHSTSFNKQKHKKKKVNTLKNEYGEFKQKNSFTNYDKLFQVNDKSKKTSLKNKRISKQLNTDMNWFKPPGSNLDKIQKSKILKKNYLSEKNSFSKNNFQLKQIFKIVQ